MPGVVYPLLLYLYRCGNNNKNLLLCVTLSLSVKNKELHLKCLYQDI